MTVTHQEAGAGRALVVLHGIGGDADCWRPQLEAFSQDFRVIAWNMPGYGGSAPLADMTFAGLATALGQLFDQLGIEQAHLVGHSMGGMIAQEFVATWPGRVSALALVGTSAAFGRPDGDWQRQFIEARLGPLDRGRTLTDLAPGLVADLVGEAPDPAGVARAVASLSAVPPASYRAAVHCLLSFDQRAALARIRVPTAVLAGEQDRVAPPAMMARLAARIAGSQFTTLAKAGHLANLEQPEAFNRALAAFLGRLRPSLR